MDAQATIDQSNSEFWNELCGSRLARRLRITARDDASITQFDAAYLETYPYRKLMLNSLASVAGLDVYVTAKRWPTRLASL